MYTHTCYTCGNMFQTQFNNNTLMCSMCHNAKKVEDTQFSGSGSRSGSLIDGSTIIKWFFLGGGMMMLGAIIGNNSLIEWGTKVLSFPFYLIVFIYFLITGDTAKATEIMHKFLGT